MRLAWRSRFALLPGRLDSALAAVVLSPQTLRAAEDWTEVIARPVPPFDQFVLFPGKPLTLPHKGGIFALLALSHAMPDLPPGTPVTGAHA